MDYPGWGDGLRITVGTEEQIAACLAAVAGDCEVDRQGALAPRVPRPWHPSPETPSPDHRAHVPHRPIHRKTAETEVRSN